MTRVFPVPAPARTSTGPSVASTASRCCGFKASRRFMWSGPRGAVILAEGKTASKCGGNERLPRADERLRGEIDFEEEKGFVVEHEGKIGNFQAGVGEPVVMVIDVEIEETVRGRVRSNYFGAESGGADNAGKRLPIFIARGLHTAAGDGETARGGLLTRLEENRVGDFFGRKRLEALARATRLAHAQANGGE